MLNTSSIYDNRLQLSVFPNPAKNHLNLSYELLEKTSVAIQVYDNTGRYVHTFHKAETSKGTHQQQFDISFLQKGVYFLLLKTNDKYDRISFIKY